MTTTADNDLMNRKMHTKGELGEVSKRYDLGEKGYLDSDEQLIRKYDVDNDGVFTLAEAKEMAADLRAEIVSRKFYRKMLTVGGVLLALSWAGNFGLTWATVALTRKVETQGGDLTDTLGNRVATKAKGDHFTFTPNLNFERDLRRLQDQADVPPMGTVGLNKLELAQLWLDHASGTPISVTWEFEGVNRTRHVYPNSQALGVSGENGETCDVYASVKAENVTGSCEVRCCGASTDLCIAYPNL